jgi:hypothetical protein
MSTFTPGPWFDGNTGEWIYEPQRLLEETENARLIAAAPQLYKALADIVTYCQCVPRRADGSVQRDSRLLYELYQSAQAALLAANPEYSDVL